MVFLYTKDKQAEKEIRVTTPFSIITNNIKNLGVTVTKEVKDLYDKNFKSAPLEPRASLSAELPDTHKGPPRIPHGILRPVVSGTQRRPQSNRAEPETAAHRKANYPGLTRAKAPSTPLEPRASLPAESPDTRKGPHRIPHGIPRPLVSGTQLLPGVWFKHQISGYLPCKKRAFLQRILYPLKPRRVLPSQVCL
jgi:hypothetical protein